MNISDIIYASTSKENLGFCEVTFYDGSKDTLGIRINDLYEKLRYISNRGRFFMIGRSALICENNIIMISPSNRRLVLACDSLGKTHQILSFSDDLLRKLRSSIFE